MTVEEQISNLNQKLGVALFKTDVLIPALFNMKEQCHDINNELLGGSNIIAWQILQDLRKDIDRLLSIEEGSNE